MKEWNRVLSVELNGVKNINHGLICFPESTYAMSMSKCKKSGILGVYGHNGSGKTALVDTFYILKEFSLQRPLVLPNKEGKIEVNSVLMNFVSVHTGVAECKFRFLQTYLNIPYVLDYSFSFGKKDNGIPTLKKEQIQILKPNPKKDGYVRFGKPWAIDYSEVTKSTIELFDVAFAYTKDIDVVAENMTKIADYAKDVQKSGDGCCSFLLSQRMNDIAKERFQGDRLQQAEIIRALAEQIAYGLFVYTMNEGALQTLGTSIFLGGDEDVHGCLMFREKNPATINAGQKKLMMRTEDHVNSIISSVVPGFKMKTSFEKAGKNEKGEELYNVRFYSVKGKAEIPLVAESNGIQKLVSIASAIAEVYANPSTWLVVDELDSGVYEPLLRSLLSSLDEEAAGQMIFTAHNLGVLEVLPHDNLVFTTNNPENRYIKLKNVKPSNNLRDFYLRSLLIGGQDEELSAEVDPEEISSSLYEVKDLLPSMDKRA